MILTHYANIFPSQDNFFPNFMRQTLQFFFTFLGSCYCMSFVFVILQLKFSHCCFSVIKINVLLCDACIQTSHRLGNRLSLVKAQKLFLSVNKCNFV